MGADHGGYFAAGPANYSDLRAVRHAELAHDLPNMKFDGTFTHRQPARNDLVRIATAQKFEDRLPASLLDCDPSNRRLSNPLRCSRR